MKSVEIVARSVDEAVQEGLTKLDTTMDEVDISVLEEGSKGIFGFIGSKSARVRLEHKPTIKWKTRIATEYVVKLLEHMDINADCTVKVQDEGNIALDLSGDNLGLLIGRRGQTLDALQYLISTVTNREGGEWVRVIIDIEGYRSRREETLKALAQRLAAKVRATGRRIALDPMNALERRVVHSELQGQDGIETHSEGRDPFRRVIILPKK